MEGYCQGPCLYTSDFARDAGPSWRFQDVVPTIGVERRGVRNYWVGHNMADLMTLRQSRSASPRQGSFVIRIRQQAAGEWAGRIEHVQTGRRGHFHNLMELMQFIESRLDAADEGERE